MYECYNKIGEKIGVAYTKREAEELINRANHFLDLERGTPEYEQRVQKAQAARAREREQSRVALIGSFIFFIVMIVLAVTCG